MKIQTARNVLLTAILIISEGLWAGSIYPGQNCYREVECQSLISPCENKVIRYGYAETAFLWQEHYHFVCFQPSGNVEQSQSFMSSPSWAIFSGANAYESQDKCERQQSYLIQCGVPHAD